MAERSSPRFAALVATLVLLWPVSALAAPWNYAALPVTTTIAFGGPPYCVYHSTFVLQHMSISFDANQNASGTLDVSMNERADACPNAPLGQHDLRFVVANGEFNSSGCVLNFKPDAANVPRVTATFVGEPFGQRYRGTLTVTRNDSAPSLNWTIQLNTLLR